MVDRQIKIILDIRGHIICDKTIDISIDPGLHDRRVDATSDLDLWGSLFVGGLWFAGDLWGCLLTPLLPCSPGLAAATANCTGSQRAHA